MTTKTDITLPPLPVWMSRYVVPADDFEGGEDRLLDDLMEEYARAAVEADRQDHLRDAAKMVPSDELRSRADAAYSAYIQQMRSRECLGWEHKVKTRKFGEAELKAHTKAGEFLGRHRAFDECANMLSRYSSGQPKPSNSGELERPAASAEPDDMPPLDDRATYPASMIRRLIREDRARRAAPVAQEPVAVRDLLRRAKVVLELIDKDRGSTICASGLVSDISTYLAAPVAAQAQPSAQDREDAGIDAAFEAVRKRLCSLPRYSFMILNGGVRRQPDKAGNWLEFDQVHALFDPVAIDATRAAKGE